MDDGAVHERMAEGHPHVLLVSVDRPPVNALTLDMHTRMYQIFESLSDRPEVRCVVLTGEPQRAFIAGADTKGLAARTPQTIVERNNRSRRNYESIRNSPVPVIAAVNGAALGAGFVIAAACDFIIASDKARFAIPEIDVGAMGGSRHARRILPPMMMRYLVMTAERVDGHFMKEHGAALEVTPAEKLLDSAFALADKLAAKSPALMRMRKESMGLVEELPFAEGYRVEQLYTALAVAHPDGQEASRSIAEKRPPKWAE